MSSRDGTTWDKVHKFDSPLDDRDVMFLSTPERLLLFVPQIEKSPEKGVVVNEIVVTTADGQTWTDPRPVYQPNFAFWRPVVHEGKFWATAYRPGSYGSRISRPDPVARWPALGKGHNDAKRARRIGNDAAVRWRGKTPGVSPRRRQEVVRLLEDIPSSLHRMDRPSSTSLDAEWAKRIHLAVCIIC